MIIDIMHKIAQHLPVVKGPEVPPSVKTRMMWTGIALIIFFLMYNTTCVGLNTKYTSPDFLETITASRVGSLLTAGIGPIVLASIFLQLFVGAGIIHLDMKNQEDKKKFMEVQKILAIVIAVVEGAVFVISGRTILAPLFSGLGEGFVVDAVTGAAVANAPYTMGLVIFQIAFGSIIIIYLDEVLNKWGIGSAISLFIAAGVSFAVVSQSVNLFIGSGGVISIMAGEGAEAIPKALIHLAPLLVTFIVFLVVVFAESMKVEIPISFERVRGMVPKLPLKFFYVSNIPVIFAAALILNVQIFGSFAANTLNLPILGVVDNSNQLRDGLFYFFTPIHSGLSTEAHINYLFNQVTPFYKIPEWVHAIVYVLTLSVISIVFGLFWVETSNMDAKSVAGQLQSSGLQITGFRRDPRMLETILNKHILPLTVVGSFSVGLLAGLADITGAMGTGTGILLTVGILYKMYEQMEQMQAFELYPALAELAK